MLGIGTKTLFSMSFVVKLETSLGLHILLAYTSTLAMDADRLPEKL